ncbi:MAG: signal recognition particle protein, partial [Candidatus Limnocylindrales bacterium]
MFDDLSDRLKGVLGRLTGRGRVTEADVDAAMREVRLALLEADVNYKVVKEFVARVRGRAAGSEVLDSLNAGQQVIKIVHEELTGILGAGDRTFHIGGSPSVIMLVGLQGSGKTTTAAKLARHITKQGRRPMLVAADPYRPAAADQLQTLGKQLDVPVHRGPQGEPVLTTVRNAFGAARQIGRDVLIVDTAGRTSVDQPLMDEIRSLVRETKPTETLLVVDAMVGQESVSVAQAFAEAAPVTGLILTKVDGDARGGAALSISAVTGLPVKFMGTGEKTDALEPFHPDRLAGRILGMGDVLTLIERAQEGFDEKQAEDMARKLQRNAFTLEDFLGQMQQLKRMGPIGGLLELLPGMGGA